MPLHISLTSPKSIEAIYFLICEFTWESSLHHAFREKKKDSFRTILVHKAWLVLRRAIIKISAGFILRDAELGWNGLFALRHCAPPWNRRYDRRVEEAYPIDGFFPQRQRRRERERESQERRCVRSVEDASWKKEDEEVRPCYRARKFFLARLDTASPLPAAASPRLSRDIVVYFPSRGGQHAFRERVRDLQRSVATDGQSGREWRFDVCIMVHRSASEYRVDRNTGENRALRKSVFTATLKCEVKGEKEDEENERIYFKDRRDVNC